MLHKSRIKISTYKIKRIYTKIPTNSYGQPKSTYYFGFNKFDKLSNKNNYMTEKMVEIFIYHKGLSVVRKVYGDLVN